MAQLTAAEFTAAEGVGDWRVLVTGACAHYRTGSFAAGLALVAEVGRLAEAADHHPDVDLRYGGVSLTLLSHDVGALTERDLGLARRISAAARELDVTPDPARVQALMIAVDAGDTPAVRAFWAAVLGYREVGEVDLDDPLARGPALWFQPLDAPRPQRNRIHLDVSVPPEVAEARVVAALAAGGRLVDDSHAPAWWTLADPEGNEVDVATWQGRG
jgi:4a-hydroxytetrahydrobiopterin dehydratase